MAFAASIVVSHVGCGAAPAADFGPVPGSATVSAGPLPERERVGDASWYGEPFHGRQTASGATYDMYAFTAAHRTLPFGTIVRVTRRDTLQSVVVEITDRGPFVAGRVIDLSYAAAVDLDLIGPGHAPVELEILDGQRPTVDPH
jgi:rare lipoprotein A